MTKITARFILEIRSREKNFVVLKRQMPKTWPPGMTKMLPGCGSPWMNPVPKIMRPYASVKLIKSLRPRSLASAELLERPRAAISSLSRLSGVPGMKSITSTLDD